MTDTTRDDACRFDAGEVDELATEGPSRVAITPPPPNWCAPSWPSTGR
ncbi:hypothetical protein [Arsenicicoccus piscis]|nr:hypothetical protein [Arsenicicoccus piscis]